MKDESMMEDSEFLSLTDAVFDRIEALIDDENIDADIERSDNVLELTLADNNKLVINRHLQNQEIWLAGRSGAFHYAWRTNVWQDTRSNGEFFTQLRKMLGL